MLATRQNEFTYLRRLGLLTQHAASYENMLASRQAVVQSNLLAAAIATIAAAETKAIAQVIFQQLNRMLAEERLAAFTLLLIMIDQPSATPEEQQAQRALLQTYKNAIEISQQRNRTQQEKLQAIDQLSQQLLLLPPVHPDRVAFDIKQAHRINAFNDGLKIGLSAASIGVVAPIIAFIGTSSFLLSLGLPIMLAAAAVALMTAALYVFFGVRLMLMDTDIRRYAEVAPITAFSRIRRQKVLDAPLQSMSR